MEKKNVFFQRRRKLGKEMRNVFGDGKCVFFAKEKINRKKRMISIFVEEKNNGEGKGGSFARGRPAR